MSVHIKMLLTIRNSATSISWIYFSLDFIATASIVYQSLTDLVFKSSNISSFTQNQLIVVINE